jgi:hypothetical protein
MVNRSIGFRKPDHAAPPQQASHSVQLVQIAWDADRLDFEISLQFQPEEKGRSRFQIALSRTARLQEETPAATPARWGSNLAKVLFDVQTLGRDSLNLSIENRPLDHALVEKCAGHLLPLPGKCARVRRKTTG